MSDQIVLKGLRAKGFHGVFEHERRDGQDFLLDVVLRLDLHPAGSSDDLAQTLDYGVLADELVAIITGEPVALIETLAERCAAACLGHAQVESAQITVHKPQAPITHSFDDVAVVIERSRDALATSAVQAVLALGSNLGDRAATLQSALDALGATPGIEVLAVSPVVETAAVGGPAQGDYLNAVLTVRTWLTPAALLAQTQRIEREHGRERTVRWGPRSLDIDIIVFAEVVQATEELELPHPRAAQRAFVLAPWAHLDPDAVIPGAGRVSVLATTAADSDGVRPRDDIRLRLPGQAHGGPG